MKAKDWQMICRVEDIPVLGARRVARERGMDVAVFQNVFLRGEWEFVAFAQFAGLRASMNTGRVAIGMKF